MKRPSIEILKSQLTPRESGITATKSTMVWRQHCRELIDYIYYLELQNPTFGSLNRPLDKDQNLNNQEMFDEKI